MTSKGIKATRLPPMPEADLQDAVIQLLHFFRFTVAHFRAGRTGSGGWATPVQADGKGFPDLLAVRPGFTTPGRTLYVELKSDKGALDWEQRRWLDLLSACPGEVYLWRPQDLQDDTITRILRDGSRPGDLWVPRPAEIGRP